MPEVDLQSPEARKSLAKMMLRLFSHWGLSEADQLALLGLGPEDQAALVRFANDEPLPESKDVLDRVSRLLTVHKLLRMLFPRNRNLCYAWVSQPNGAFDGRTPVSIMCKQGLAGIILVERYLDSI